MKKTTGIAVVGALGRMGREIGKIILHDPQASLAGALEVPEHPDKGKDYASLLGESPSGVSVETDLATVATSENVLISFSSPGGVDNLLDSLDGKSTRLVLGTTGLSENQIQRVEKLSQNIPVVFSPNMSMGVNLLFHLTSLVASRLAGDFDIEIVEAHHRHKQDSPSGTAKRLGEVAAEAIGQVYEQAVRHGRSGLTGERTKTEIGMHAVRGGEIVGDHTVLFAGSEERLELRHMAQSRATFARGAVTAAKWLADQNPGLYSMIDVLGLS